MRGVWRQNGLSNAKTITSAQTDGFPRIKSGINPRYGLEDVVETVFGASVRYEVGEDRLTTYRRRSRANRG